MLKKSGLLSVFMVAILLASICFAAMPAGAATEWQAQTYAATGIAVKSATMKGSVTQGAGGPIYDYGFYYGTNESSLENSGYISQRNDSTMVSTIDNNGNFTAEYDYLNPGTTYYFTAFVEYYIDYQYDKSATSKAVGNIMSFTTKTTSATHLVLSTPEVVTIGKPFTFTVTPEDVNDATVTDYSGPINFTSSDPSAVLPQGLALDNGAGTYSATLNTAGQAGWQTITATISGSITGTSNSINVTSNGTLPTPTAPVTASASNVTGASATLNATVSNDYAGSVTSCGFNWGTDNDAAKLLQSGHQVNSSATNSSFSADINDLTPGTTYYFVAWINATTGTDEAGNSESGSFNSAIASFTTPSSVAASGTSTTSPTATNTTRFAVQTPASATSGVPFSFSLKALDANNDTATGYSGTIHFTSSDTSASLPADATLTDGAGTFSATLKASGWQTITATDTSNASITGSNNTNVKLPVTSSSSSSSSSSASSSLQLTATPGNGSIALTWTTSGQSTTGYNLYRGTTAGGESLRTDTPVTGNSFTDQGAINGLTYYYIVKPVDSNGSEGAASNEVSATPNASASASSSSSSSSSSGSSALQLTATAGNGSVTLNWTAPSDTNTVVGYYPYRGASAGGESADPLTDFPVTGNSYTDQNVQNGSTYYYYLKPVFSDQSQGAESNEVSATPGTVGSAVTIVLQVGSTTMTVNGQASSLDTAPEMKYSRVFLPISPVIKAMGGNVAWDAASQQVTITLGSDTIVLWVGQLSATVNGQSQTLDVAPYISASGRTMLPLRFIAGSLSCQLAWDQAQQMVTLTYPSS